MLIVDCIRCMLVLLGVQHSVGCRVSCVVWWLGCVDIIILSRCDLQLGFRNVLIPNVAVSNRNRPLKPQISAFTQHCDALLLCTHLILIHCLMIPV
jgi:hypothetical protein